MSLIEAKNEAVKVQTRYPGSVAIVTENRLSRSSRKTWFSFRFAINEKTDVGREITNDDGSIAIIRSVIA